MSADPPNIKPSLEQVGAIIRSRTRYDSHTGQESGTFDETTRPTADEVSDLIEQAESDVLIRCPADLEDLGERLLGAARRLVALRAALLVELALYSDDKSPDESGEGTYDRLKALWDEASQSFTRALADLGLGNQPPEHTGRLGSIEMTSPYSGDAPTTLLD